MSSHATLSGLRGPRGRLCTGTALSTGRAGSGPPVVLIHGMVNSSRHWETVALRLADSYTVIAPDLIGHGDSATPRGDYSLGAHAASIRDLLAAIGVERATIVGHSLGGGVAMQFFYQFPQRTERLVLISSGGLGHEVSPLLRGGGAARRVGAAARSPPSRAPGRRARRRRRAAARARHRARASTCRRSRGRCGRCRSPASRRAFLQTLRSVIDVHGQRVSARDRLYLLGDDADADRLGRARPHDPARARPRGRTRRSPAAASRRCPAPPTSRNLEDPEGLAARPARLPRRPPPPPTSTTPSGAT